MKAHLRFALALATALSGYAWGQPIPKGCGPIRDSVCLSSKTDIEGTYCMRDINRDGLAIRKVYPDTWSLKKESHEVKLDHVKNGSSNCTLPAGKQIPATNGDFLEIRDPHNGSLTVDITHGSGHISNFGGPITIPKPTEAQYYLEFNTGSNGPPAYSDLDIFLMIADEPRGYPTAVDNPKIEKYFRIEVFPSIASGALVCSAERPDMLVMLPGISPPGLTTALMNFKRAATVQDLAICGQPANPKHAKKSNAFEVVTGGGNEHPPN